MTARIFVDTNVLVYARDSSERTKQRRAQSWLEVLWRDRTGRISSQVLHEYYITVTRKLKPGLRPEEAREDVRDLLAWNPVPLSAELLEEAWLVEDRFSLSFWDSLIVSAARTSECQFLLSEDMQHSQRLDRLTVIDPFEVDPATFKA